MKETKPVKTEPMITEMNQRTQFTGCVNLLLYNSNPKI